MISSIPMAIKWITKERHEVVVMHKARRLTLMAIVRLTWKARNTLVYDGTIFEPRHIVFEVKKITYATLYSIYLHEIVQRHLGS